MHDIGQNLSTEDKKDLLDAISLQVSLCDQCDLHRNRIGFVSGHGNLNADVMFIGEGPTKLECKQDILFVEQSGETLDRILKKIGVNRDDIFFSNIVKCCHSSARDPRPAELFSCRNHLENQIHIISPKILVAMGGFASNSLLQTQGSMKRLRGKWCNCKIYGLENYFVMCTYHPASIFRSPENEDLITQDLEFVFSQLK